MNFTSAIIRTIFAERHYGDFDKILAETYMIAADAKLTPNAKKAEVNKKLLSVVEKLDKADLERIRTEFVQLGKKFLAVLPKPSAESEPKK